MKKTMTFKSPISLASLQLQRNSLSELQEAKSPWREALLEGFRRRNAILDAIFYDIGKITPSETQDIAPWLAREGALLIVPPTGAGKLQLCRDLNDFVRNGGTEIRSLAVAGVGSSALGSAAFARNIADAFGEPVAAVVSGYGLADLLTEAAGGWFWFGWLNDLRHRFEQIDDLFRGNKGETEEMLASCVPSKLARTSLDTRTVCSLLADKRFRFSLLTGHSKGNLVISEALYSLDEKTTSKTLQNTWIVTVSATVAMPPFCKNIIDVIGQIDWFGRMNSRPSLGVEEELPLATHHTNTELLWHLPVFKVFQKLITHYISLRHINDRATQNMQMNQSA
jgi:hypothetical protein